jgi:N-acyl homoserine lactone hydrolase
VNTYEAYDIMLKIKEMADILLPLHEPAFAAVREIPSS